MSAGEQVFMLPDLGEGLTEAEVVEWLVAEGDEVAIDQNVVTVETAKATVEVPIPFAGVVSALHGRVGDVMEVGRPLISVGGAGAGAGGAGASEGAGTADPGHSASDPRAGHEQYRREERAGAEVPQDGGETTDEGSGAVLIGFGTGHGGGSRRRRAPRGAAPSAASAPPATPSPSSMSSPDAPESSRHAGESAGTGTSGARIAGGVAPKVISPLVRRLASEHGVDLATLTPSQADGVIRRADVDAAIASPTSSSTPAAMSSPDAPESSRHAAESAQTGTSGARIAGGAGGAGGAVAGQLSDERIPLTGLMRMMSERLTTSRTEIPDATTWVDADATQLLRTKDAVKAARPEAGIGVLPLMARIVVAGLHRHPALNASIEMQDGTAVAIQRHARINLGFAAQSPRGLVVPVVHDAQDMSTTELAAALRELTGLAREGRLTPAQLTGGTFTLNNYGVFGVDGSTPIINHPEAAMLGVGRIIDRPWAVGGKVKVRKVTQLGFTFDHRVCDGGTAGGFLRFVADCVENPAVLLSEL
ncbi:dihydrolipoamide acetyltransferase family protein [Kytococcus sedentarius]|uniref:dihydrolipoamide acetyltransferase family protein n=1 Tax=Kytococcus sedentarius TaxID=1276 RepID=UPI0035BC888F